MKYGDMVKKLGKQAGDEAAIYYDKNFREWRASNPSSFPWDNLNSEIHSEALAVSLGKSRVGSASVSGVNRKFSSSSPQFFRGSSSPKYPCHSFNNRGFCNRERCPYTHACQKCGGTRTKKQCNSWKAQTPSKSDDYQNQNAGKNTNN